MNKRYKAGTKATANSSNGVAETMRRHDEEQAEGFVSNNCS